MELWPTSIKSVCYSGYEQEQCTVATIEIDQSDKRGTVGPERRRDGAVERQRERQGAKRRSASWAGHTAAVILVSGWFTVRSCGLVWFSVNSYQRSVQLGLAISMKATKIQNRKRLASNGNKP